MLRVRCLVLGAQFGDRRQLADRCRQFGLRFRVVDTGGVVRQRFLGTFLGRDRSGLVQILAANRGVGQHRHGARLHFQQAAGDEDKFFLSLTWYLDADSFAQNQEMP